MNDTQNTRKRSRDQVVVTITILVLGLCAGPAACGGETDTIDSGNSGAGGGLIPEDGAAYFDGTNSTNGGSIADGSGAFGAYWNVGARDGACVDCSARDGQASDGSFSDGTPADGSSDGYERWDGMTGCGSIWSDGAVEWSDGAAEDGSSWSDGSLAGEGHSDGSSWSDGSLAGEGHSDGSFGSDGAADDFN